MIENLIIAGVCGFVAAMLASLIILKTSRFHGALTFDKTTGLQKFHSAPTPRIGGISLIIGVITVAAVSNSPMNGMWVVIAIAGAPAFIAGLAEDITNKVSVKIRLAATAFSGVIFVQATGYSIQSVDLWWIDPLLSFSAVSIIFTAFAIGGIANAINIIDGFHGLAAGTVILILFTFAIVGLRVGDMLIFQIASMLIFIVFAFLIFNFPFGKLFLGDAGAYFLGYLVACLAVMLPARNPEVSPWVSLLILGYPLTETLVSIVRKTRRAGHSPGLADRVHLHMLVYRSFGRNLSNRLQSPQLKSAMTSVLLWGFSGLNLVFLSFSDLSTLSSIGMTVVIVVLYILLYRRVALMRKRK